MVDVATGAHRVLTRPSSNPDTTSGVESPASLSHVSWSTNGRDIAFDGTQQVTCPITPGFPPGPTLVCR